MIYERSSGILMGPLFYSIQRHDRNSQLIIVCGSHPATSTFTSLTPGISMKAQLNLRSNALATFRNESNWICYQFPQTGQKWPLATNWNSQADFWKQEHAYGGSHSISSSSVSFLSVQFMENWECLNVHSYYTPDYSVLTTRLMEFEMFYYHRVSICGMIGREEFYFIPTSELLTILTKILTSPHRQSEDCT